MRSDPYVQTKILDQIKHIESRIVTLDALQEPLRHLLSSYERKETFVCKTPSGNHYKSPQELPLEWGSREDGSLSYVRTNNPSILGIEETSISWGSEEGVYSLKYNTGADSLRIRQVARFYPESFGRHIRCYAYEWGLEGESRLLYVDGSESPWFLFKPVGITFWEFYEMQKRVEVKEFLLKEVLPYEV